MRFLCLLSVLTWSFAAFAQSAWTGRLAPAATAETSIEQHRQALAANPNDLASRWQLLSALHYFSEFSDAPEDERDAAVEEAVAVASDSIDRVIARDATDPTTEAQIYFWSAIAWGARGQRVGLLTIVREGVARKMYEYASRAAELSPAIERGGAYRLLSRLHAELPRVPFVSGWVDREQALPLAERAFGIDPSDPGNQLILALALLERAPERKDEARTLLRSAANAQPREELRAQDLAISEQASERLADL